MSTASTATRTPSVAQVEAATRATYVAFIAAGIVSASWAARIPQIRDQLHLTSADLGLVLLAVATGSLVALPLAGTIVQRLNSRRTVAAMALLLSVGLGIMSIGYLYGVVPVVIGFFVLGFANGAWDVAMNVQGATVERHRGRAIMPRFHAGYSVGTVIGALVGAAMIVFLIPVTVHLLVVAACTAVVVPLAVRTFVPDNGPGIPTTAETDREDDLESREPARASAMSRWREPRTLLIGVFVLAFAFAEGTGNDWISISLIDGYGVPAVAGTLGFATFLAAMTGARWLGPGLLDHYGRVPVVRGLAGIAVLGILLFVFSPNVPLAYLGALLWGMGASLGFPVGMSAASDEPAGAAGRVSVVASIGYCAFLAGPPLIGFLGSYFTVLRSLTLVAAVVALSALVAGSLKPRSCVTNQPEVGSVEA